MCFKLIMKKEGLVILSTGSWYDVLTDDGIVKCRLRGKFRIKGIKTTNPVVVGDRVVIEQKNENETPFIIEISERKNYIIRKSTNLSKVSHIIASNIDIAFLVITLRSPRTSSGFIDRFLTAAEAYRIPVHLVFNKIDIYNEDEKLEIKKIALLYEKIGYTCYYTSVVEDIGIQELREVVKDKTVLFSGHSGVGKSALINSIDENLDIRVGDISEVHDKGKHTTTFAQIHLLSFGGFVVDSPGIKEFGLIDYNKDEISHFFLEMRKYLNKCRFNNCTHTHEPGCMVKEAVESGEINIQRYNNYLAIMSDEDMDLESWQIE